MNLSKNRENNPDAPGPDEAVSEPSGKRNPAVESEKLRNFLLDISNVKNRFDLKQAIMGLDSLMEFSKVSLLLTGEEKGSENSFFENVDLQPCNVTANLFCHEQVMKYAVSELPKDDRQVKQWHHNNTTGIAGILLSENLAGYMYFEGKSFSAIDMNLIKSIAVPVSNAVTNILLIERNRQLENEKDLLLNLFPTIAAVSNIKDLQDLAGNQLRKFLNPYKFVITFRAENTIQQRCIAPERLSIPGFEYDEMSEPSFMTNNKLHDDHFLTARSSLFVNDLTELALINARPLFLTFKQFSEFREKTFADATGSIIKDAEILILGLGTKQRKMGLLILILKGERQMRTSQINLFKWVSSQLTVVIKNILDNEAALKRESEKSDLLAFSNDAALVRDKVGLEMVLNNILKKLFSTSEYILTIRGDDKQSHVVYLYKVLTQSSKLKQTAESAHAITGKLAELVFNSDKPLNIDLDEVVRDVPYKELQTDFFKSINFSVMTAMPLRVDKIDIGILWMRAEKANERLLSGISSPLAIAIANIRANEKIAFQLQEISDFKEQLKVENLYLQEEIETTHNYSEIVGSSRKMGDLFHLVSQVAGTSSSVLILGETGTGKELIARAIHNTSPRKNRLMVKINCATLPPNLIESELFGHERGSFTGATERRIGKFELANNSTLFLDEIGELPLDLQVKLLRALQEKEIERVGGKTVIKTNVRIIAATNRDLKQEVKLGNFRSDLYFRLNVFPIFIPPLRDRKEDINLLATHFLNKHAKKGGKKIIGFSSKVIKQLKAYDWPGNVRELEHLIERSILLATQPVINAIQLPSRDNDEHDSHLSVNRVKTIDEIEREHILYVLQRCNGKVSGVGGAAQALNIPSTTLGSKIKRLGITKEFTSE
jgi:formate hydrogenlyase transcriptional activator